jgi:serine/threonine protein kinase
MSKLFNFWPFNRSKRYGGYELVEQIAKGGMSRIWKAKHPETGQIVALKILTPESVELMQLFRRFFETEEGQVALKLNHPNVIRTYEYGRGRKSEYYLVMEYVAGPNLEMLVARRSDRVRENRFRILMQMGSGLRYIHEQGLIHRDFCPKNVLFGEEEVAKIIDFGLTIPASAKEKSGVLRAGTASFMAPEQVRGRPVDERTDIYAYGLSCYEVLSGRRPMPGGRDVSQRMQDQLNVDPPALRRICPELPEELQTVVEKCFAKEVNMRYKSMDEVMKDMRIAVEIARSQQG